MRKTVNFILNIFLSLLLLQCQKPQITEKKPNIILIVTDDQGFADLSAYSHVSANCETPNMDRIAERGVLFDNCYVSSPGRMW